MNVMLPRVLFPASSLPSPSPSPSAKDAIFPVVKSEGQDENRLPPVRQLPFPLVTPKHAHNIHNRRTSTSSTASAPSLTYSPSPSPSPPPTCPTSPESFLLVPCPINVADAVVVIGSPDPSAPSSSSASPIFRPCKPSEGTATLLIGPAISAHARRNAAKPERRMHPYRIVRERRTCA